MKYTERIIEYKIASFFARFSIFIAGIATGVILLNTFVGNLSFEMLVLHYTGTILCTFFSIIICIIGHV